MTSRARKWLASLFACGAVAIGANNAQAAYPEHQVHLLVGYAPGGATDILARLLAQKLTEKWGQPVTAENKPGAGGSLAADYIAHAAPDGYNIILITSNHVVPPIGYKPNYDVIKSFAPITNAAYVPSLMIVNSNTPVHSVKEFIDYTKARPGKLNFGSTGPGTAQFMDIEHFQTLAGLDMVNVTYGGASPILVGLLGGEIQLAFGVASGFLETLKTDKIRALAISGRVRSPLVPNIPTFPEAAPDLKGYEGSNNWYGLVAPANTPKEVIAKIHDDVTAIIKSPDVQKTLVNQSFITVASSPEEFTKTMVEDQATWAELMKNISPNIK